MGATDSLGCSFSARGAPADDHSAMRSLGADQPLRSQTGIGVPNRMEVYSPAPRSIAKGRESGPWLERARGDPVADAFGQLVVERERRGGVEAESH